MFHKTTQGASFIGYPIFKIVHHFKIIESHLTRQNIYNEQTPDNPLANFTLKFPAGQEYHLSLVRGCCLKQ